MEPKQTPADFTQPTPPTPTGAAPLPIKHHHKPVLIFALLLIVITGLIASYFLFFTPQSQALSKATETIKLLSDADENKLNSLAQADDPFIKNFYQSVRSQVQNSSYKVIDKKIDNSTYYFLFELDGSASKYLRVIVEKADAWKVTSITHSQQILPLAPQDYATDKEPAETIATRIDAGFTCLVQSDYALTNFNPTEQDFLQWSSIYEPTSSVANKSASIFFKSGTTEEEGFADFYTTWARFSDDMTEKQWLFRIRPNVNEKSIGTVREHQDTQSAYERASKIKQELLNKSVPDTRIVIVDPLLSATEYTDENEPILRRVEMVIDPTCVTK
jgi:hypothetical protein